MENGDRIMFSGILWERGMPEARIRVNSGPSMLVPVSDLVMGFSTSNAARRCIGHKPFRDRASAWVDCDRAPLSEGHKCDRCAANDATFASQLHHAHTRGSGELDASIQAHLAQENHLYLAAFRDGTIKVGTSTSHRLQTRLSEQGAWRASVVATASNGITVRELEAEVTAELGIVQSVSVRRKIAGLARPVTNEVLSKELSRWTKPIHCLIDDLGSEGVTPTDTEWRSPITSDPVWTSVTQYGLKLTSGNHALDFLSASGRVGAFRRPGLEDTFIADLRELYGLEVELSPVEPDELHVQDALF